MACYRPLKAYRPVVPGKVAWDSKRGYVDRPLTIGCGKCVGCRLDKAQMWAARCLHESRMHPENAFLTLTYAPAHLPKDGSLNKVHFQEFCQRLRDTVRPFRYFMVGEYGPKTFRPHYHALIFGIDFHQDKVLLRYSAKGYPCYVSPLVNRLWGKGEVTIGDVVGATAAYTAMYSLNKVPLGHEDLRRIDHVTGEEYYVQAPFSLMSRRPGIGKAWFAKYRSDIYPSDQCVVEGRVQCVPRYYDKLLEREDPAAMEAVRAKRVLKSMQRLDSAGLPRPSWPVRGESVGDASPPRLRDREICATAKVADARSAI